MGGVACPAVAYLHQRAAVLEPELDLARLQAQAPAQVGALLVVRVGALLEQPAQTTPTRSRGAPRTRVRRNESALTLRAAGSGPACGGGSASSACAGSRCRPRRRRRRQRRRRPGGRWPSGCRSPPPPKRPWRRRPRRRAPPTNPFARRCRRGPLAITHERATHSRITLDHTKENPHPAKHDHIHTVAARTYQREGERRRRREDAGARGGGVGVLNVGRRLSATVEETAEAHALDLLLLVRREGKMEAEWRLESQPSSRRAARLPPFCSPEKGYLAWIRTSLRAHIHRSQLKRLFFS
jgi:hypothetical protein